MNTGEKPCKSESEVVVEQLLLVKFFQGYAEDCESPLNSWGAGEAMHHPPSSDEKRIHSLTHGGFGAFRKRFALEHPEFSFTS
ncbi:MAG: hypothetical protein WCW03_01650 [Candidatus Paceibacterota bacterium]|jgi:hypothetical protein